MSKNKKRRKNKNENIESNNFNEYFKFNDKQLSTILKEIKLIHENQNEKIDKSVKEINDFNLEQNKIKDSFSRVVRWTMFTLFVAVGIILTFGTVFNIPVLWNSDFYNNLAVIILIALGIVLIVLGASIIKIDDRNYLISIFSAIVALAALIVSIIK